MAQQQPIHSNDNDDRPACTECNVPMWLKHIEPLPNMPIWKKTSTYRCPLCEREVEGEL